MEPPAKRPRLGISPFNNDDEDDVDGDELNLEPEQVNALRDPGYQLERSRAHAANRLKSAWERIFEKYEKDFTGIGDEIDLETGEVVVDNGHIQSLQYTEIGGEGGDEDDEEDEEGDEESIDEEEKLLQGKGSTESRLSTVGEDQNSTLTSLVRQLAPLGQPRPWSGIQWGMAGPPRISSMFGPPNPFGSFSAPFNVPGGVDTLADPAWKAPELPVVEKYVDPAWRAPDLPPPKPPGSRITTVKRKLLPARGGHVDGDGEQDEDEDEDDILMGASATPTTRPSGGVTVKKMKMLLPPNPAQGSSFGSHGIALKPKSTPKSNGISALKPKESTGKRKAAPENSKKDTLARLSPKSGPSPKDCAQMKKTQRPHSHGSLVPKKQVLAVKSKKSTESLQTQQREVVTETPDADMYINPSSDNPLTAKPTNQRLSVDIVVRKKIDTALYQVVKDVVDDRRVENVNQQQVDASEETNTSTKDMGVKKRPRHSAVKKTFARNVIDSSYGFSDDEEPALPKPKRIKQRPPTPRGKTGQDALSSQSQPQEAVTREVGAINGLTPAFDETSAALKERGNKTLAYNEEREEPTDQEVPEESQPQEKVVEGVYTRNVVDPSFRFSDEDETALPKAKIRGGGQLAREKSKNAVQKETADDEATLTAVEVPSPSSIDLNDGQQEIPHLSADEQPVHDENGGLHEQETVLGDMSIPGDSSKSPIQGGDNDVTLAVDDLSPQAPVESAVIPSTLEGSPKNIELQTEHDTTTQFEQPALPADNSESTVTGPIDFGEAYPIRLLSMKPRRKRKISTAFTEESLVSPTVLEEGKPKETYISAPVKRFKKPKQTHPIQVLDQDVDSQPVEQTVQAQPEPELPVGNVLNLQEPNPTSPAIQESPQPQAPAPAPEETETTIVDAELTIPESSPLIQPAFRSSLLGIVQEEDLSTLAQMDDSDAGANPDPENDMDISIDLGLDFDSPPSDHGHDHDHNPHPTPLPDLPSPELGEEDHDLNPETSPLPYSSPSKAVKAAKVKKVRKPAKPPQLQPQPSTPSKKRGRPKKQHKEDSKPQISSYSANPPSSALSARTKGLLSLLSDDEGEDDDELSLTPDAGARPRYSTPPNVRNTADKLKHTSLTAPLMRMKLLSSSKKGIANNPRTPSSRRKTLMSTVALNDNDENQKPRGGRGILPSSVASSKMYFSADRRASLASSSSGAVVINSSGAAGLRSRGGITKRRRSGAAGGSRLAANPVVPEYVDDSVVETPGGTKRRCGEDGFHCDRDFCFVCL